MRNFNGLIEDDFSIFIQMIKYFTILHVFIKETYNPSTVNWIDTNG